jgi:hypothetical protein
MIPPRLPLSRTAMGATSHREATSEIPRVSW